MSRFDYIIVGAGSAGCVLANRLGQDLSKQILVLEAGPMDRDLMIHVPVGVHKAWRDPKLNWNYTTDVDGQDLFFPRGRVVGGSSSINSMVYMRGHPWDYDAWATDFGLKDWSFDQCLPYFRAGETYSGGSDAYRGGEGPLGTTRGDYDNPLYDAFIQAGEQAGQGRTDDPNGYQPEGLCRFDATKRNGWRCSAAVAHLKPALKRGNVTLMTGAAVQRVLFNARRVTGVEVLHRGSVQVFEADEVILSGGAINSPHVLMLSGIGPADHLAQHGIDCRVDAPGVGANLQDHANVILQWECLQSFPIHRVDRPWNKAMAGARWVFLRDGVAASNIWEAGGVIRSNDHVAYGNIQYHFGPVGFEYTGNKISLSQGFAIHIDQLRPRSRGDVRLCNADPSAKPILTFNYLSDPHDMTEMIEGVQKTRELVAQGAFEGLRGREISPGPDVLTHNDIERWLRRHVETDFHPCGTCAIGDVVDARFCVKGVEGLRVVDASVMPRIVSGNLNAPTQMIAARAADWINGQTQLPAQTPEFAFQ